MTQLSAPSTPAPSSLSNEQKTIAQYSATELVDHLALLLQHDQIPDKKEIERIKALFYKLKHKLDAPSASTEEKEVLEVQEIRLDDLLKIFKQRDQVRMEAVERAHAEAKVVRDHILEQLAKFVEGCNNFSEGYLQYSDLRTQWEQAGEVSTQVWVDMLKRYRELQERYYSMPTIDDDRRQEEDFTKHLEQRNAILDEMKSLEQSVDPVGANLRMVELQKNWDLIGPIAPEVRGEIYTQYRALKTSIYKQHQGYQDSRKEGEQENLRRKIAYCEQVEAVLDPDNLPKSNKKWDEVATQVKQWQQEWKQIGRTPQGEGPKVYQRYRAAMDAFFEARAQFYAAHKEQYKTYTSNIAKKRALIEEAKALAQSEDWQATTSRMLELQNEWKTVGDVPLKYREGLWKEFRAQMDIFFGRRQEYQAQLPKRRQASTKQGHRAQGKEVGSESTDLERIKRKLEKVKQDLQLYETNQHFLSIDTQQGATLLKSIENKIQGLRKHIVQLQEQLKTLQSPPKQDRDEQ